MSDKYVLRTLRESAGFDPDSVLLVSKAADLIEQQAERIRELEAVEALRNQELAALREKHGNALIAFDTLRAKIENAEVVAWGDYLGQVRTQKELDMMYAIGDRRTCAYDRPLIRKEDLLK